jgi:hypothetical protein
MKRDIKTIADVKSLEHQSKDCSSKYVPIKSSEFINELKDFDLNGGFKYINFSTAKQIKLSQFHSNTKGLYLGVLNKSIWESLPKN